MNRPLNIVRIISFLPIGGVENTLLATLHKFDKSRFNISVCCTYRKGPVADKLEAAGIPVHLSYVGSRLNPIHLWRLARLLKSLKTDIVHTHMYSSNITGAVAARLAGVPVIISHIHSAHEWTSQNRIWMERIVNSWRSGVIAVSQHVKNEFLKTTGLRCAEKVKVLHNIAMFAEKSARNPALLREQLGISPQSPVIGFVARLVPIKGADIFLRAAQVILRERPDARFVLVGDGKERPRLAALARELNIAPQVIFAGEQKNVSDYYNIFDIFVLSSRSEGFGNVILEAMHHDIPVVASAVGGVPEIVLHEQTGLLFPAENHEALAEAAAALLSEPARAVALVEGARNRLEHFAPEKYIKTLEQCYHQTFWSQSSKNIQTFFH